MGRTVKGLNRDGVYRPQRPKGRKRSKMSKDLGSINSSGSGIVGRVRKWMEENRGQGIGPGKLSSSKGVVSEDTEQRTGLELGLKEPTFEFHKERPYVDKQEKRRVKRNLFGIGGEKKSYVNRKLKEEIRSKKQLLKSRQSRHVRSQHQSSNYTHHERKNHALPGMCKQMTPRHKSAHYKHQKRRDQVFPKMYKQQRTSDTRQGVLASTEVSIPRSPASLVMPGFLSSLPCSSGISLSDMSPGKVDSPTMSRYSENKLSASSLHVMNSFVRSEQAIQPSFYGDISYPCRFYDDLTFVPSIPNLAAAMPSFETYLDQPETQTTLPNFPTDAVPSPTFCEDPKYLTTYSDSLELSPVFPEKLAFKPNYVDFVTSTSSTSITSVQFCTDGTKISSSSSVSVFSNLNISNQSEFFQSSSSSNLLDMWSTSIDWDQTSLWCSSAPGGEGVGPSSSCSSDMADRIMWGLD